MRNEEKAEKLKSRKSDQLKFQDFRISGFQISAFSNEFECSIT